MSNTNTLTKKQRSLHTLTKIAVLTAISSVIMLLEFPLWFAPGFYKLDLSEAVILMGGFAMGPAAAAVIELLKNLINLLLNGTSTAFVGELGNFIIGCAFVVPASIIYKYVKNRKGAIISLIVGTLSLAFIGGLVNYFVLIPAYSHFYHVPIEALVGQGSAVNPLVTDMKTLVVFATTPFNIIKGILCSVVNLLLYKRLSKILHI